MKLLVVAATKAELGKVFEHFNLPDKNFVQQDKFDILITGVGMTATAFALGRHLNSIYNLVVNVGIAGSFDKNIPLGSLLNINTDTFSELGAENHDEFITIDELGFGNNTFKATYQIVDLPIAKGITVNKVHGNANSIAKIEQKFNPQTESMEGAVVFYGCNTLQIPCAQVRSISNYVEPRNKENWQMGLAIKNLNDWLIDFINAKTK
ncbi:futalosine hydrolase [Pedobacter sp. UC225_61]|uniref:futalosine hydrolase n=1 Tax=Pedobacter sp. UC225_61 TaxID=3374623 RepID=UPI00378E2260